MMMRARPWNDAMISKETMADYRERASSLMKLFLENLSKANDLIVENSPVDYLIHKFICISHICYIQTERLNDQFSIEILDIIISSIKKRDDAYARELINKFHSLEEELAFQKEALEILESTHTARAGEGGERRCWILKRNLIRP